MEKCKNCGRIIPDSIGECTYCNSGYTEVYPKETEVYPKETEVYPKETEVYPKETEVYP